MRIGDLRHRLTFQSMTQTADGMGSYTEAAKNEMVVWGAIWPVSANEATRSGQLSTVITHRIRVRYRNEIKTKWRIKYGDRYFQIISIIDQNTANRVLDILCKEAES